MDDKIINTLLVAVVALTLYGFFQFILTVY